MTSIVFDASTIISLAMTNTLWILRPLKKKLKGEMYLPEEVKKEVIDRPLHSPRFKLEALQVLSLIADGTFKIYKKEKTSAKEEYLSALVDNMFFARGRYLKVAHAGEIGMIAVAIITNSEAVAIDERTTRLLIENPTQLERILESKLHTDVKVNRQNMDFWKREVSGLRVVRSAELGVIAFEEGILEQYMDPAVQKLIDLPLKRSVLEGFLWATKLSGCAITSNEIRSVLRIEKLRR